MKTEDYVSYEQAVKLREKGFRWMCDHYYRSNSDFYECHPRQCFNEGEYERYDACTLSQAQKWLREEKTINVFVHRTFDSTKRAYYAFSCHKIGNIRPSKYTPHFNSYEEALSAGITKALELI